MATGTVADERKERKRELETRKGEMAAAMERYAAAEVAASVSGDGSASHPALVDRRIRRTALSAARLGLEAAYRSDASDGSAPACAECGVRMRHAGREESPVETALGRVRLSMARHACDGCATTVRRRERALDIEGSMTPAARRMASLAGSSCCYGEADKLLEELADVNFGAKARRKRHGIERTTRSVGDDVESRRRAALSGALSVAVPGGRDAPARKPPKAGEVLCVALDGTGVPARRSETEGRAGRDGGRAGTREAKVGALWLLEPDGGGGLRTVAGSVRTRRAATRLRGRGEHGGRRRRRLAGGAAAVRRVVPERRVDHRLQRRRRRRPSRPAAANAPRRPATSPSGATACATTSTWRAACPSARAASRRPARPSSDGA